MIAVYRCSKCKYILDRTGYGASKVGGRWNSKGVYMLYAAGNPSLALLESIVHMAPVLPGIDFCMVQINCGGDSIKTISQTDLKPGWHTDPSPYYLKKIGDRFIHENKYLMLRVPSAVLTIEWNILINPGHPLMPDVIFETPIPLTIDPRIKKT